MIHQKTYDYVIVTKAPAGYKLIDLISQLMLLMAAAAFIYEGAKNLTDSFLADIISLASLYFLAAAIIIYWLIYCFIRKRNGYDVFYRFALFIAACGWYLNKQQWFYMSISYLIASVLERPLKVTPEVAFDTEELVFNTVPKKKYLWDQVANVVLKEGILTIDLKNNKLIQKEIDADISEADEQDFNDFCRHQLKKAV